MRKPETVMSKGGSATGIEGDMADFGEERDQNQVGSEEAHNPEQGGQRQTRQSRIGKGRPLEDRQPEEEGL